MKALLASCAVLASVSAAAAGDLYCILRQADGTELEYRFAAYSNDFAAEVHMKRGNRTVASYRPGNRPPWRVISTENTFTLQSVRDPDWRIVMTQRIERRETVKRGDAILLRRGEPMAAGGCGWLIEGPAEGGGI